MIILILVHAVQMLGVLIPAFGCIFLLRKAQSKSPMYLLLSNIGCLIVNVSYMLLLQTKTYEGALIALKMEYFGNVLFYLAFGLFLWSYLKLKSHKWTYFLFALWCLQDIVFLIFIWSGNLLPFAFDGLSYVFEDLQFQWSDTLGLVLIQSTPGVLYMLRYSTMCVVLLCGMVYTTVRIFLVQIPAERNNLAKLAGAQAVIFASLELMLLFSFPFDIVPIFASLSILSIIISVHQDEFFGITDLGHEWVLDQMESVFILVDSMHGYLESNPYARKVFPELDYKRQNETVSGDMYRIFTNDERVLQIQGRYYSKRVMEFQQKGKVAGYSLFLVDVTEQYELMARVREEKERADAANQAKSAFVSNVSHEIRTPMNAIVGMTQLLLRRELPKQEREYLLNIQNSGNALLAMINDLLDLSKMESGKMELVEEEYDFMSMLSDLGMILLNRIGSKPVELLFDIDPKLPKKLYGDALRIRQIIINLMNNATKFTEEGNVRLTVKVGEVRQEDIELLLSVRDTGYGIKEEDIGKLFGSFQQVDTKKNHHKEGTGLGLSISKQLVELMHGSIGVRSEYGKGSEFYFTIHQKIADGARAAWLPEGSRACIAGNLKNRDANELLLELAKAYGLIFAEDAMQLKETKLPVFYFTDQYGALGEEEGQTLTALSAVVCGMQNPMAENDFPEGLLTMNKPLYSHNFCELLRTYLTVPAHKQDGAPDVAWNAKQQGVRQTDVAKVGVGKVGARQPEAEKLGTGQAEAEKLGAEKPEDRLPQERRRGGGEEELFLPDAHVLIVDDNEINRMVAEEMLKPLGMQLDTASDGKQAVAMVQEKKYDLVFMDHLMPVMDGVEAVKEIRKLAGEYYQALPVIALTGNTAKEQQEEYRRAGMNDYLSKPMDMEELHKKVKKWVTHRAQSARDGRQGK